MMTRFFRHLFSPSGLSLLITLCFLSGLFLVASIYVVVEYQARPKATFQSVPSPSVEAAKAVERKVKIDRRKSRAQSGSRAATVNRITTIGKSAVALPASPQISSLGENFQAGMLGMGGLGGAGLGAGKGMGAGSGLGVGRIKFKFLGVSDVGERIVICFDISKSVVNNMAKAGLDILEVKQETRKLVDSFNSLTMFGLIQHARNYDAFDLNLRPATVENKRLAWQWMDTKFRTDGMSGTGWKSGEPNGIQAVLRAAFAMNPDVIFLISDGSYQRGKGSAGENVPWPELVAEISQLQEDLPRPARVHFIGFGVNAANEKEARKLVSRFGGKYVAHGK